MRGREAIVLALAALAACALAVGFSMASFTDTSQNPQAITAAADFIAPSAGASVIGKSQNAQSGATGYIKAGGTYYAYANVTDSGNPASGVASVKADVSSITSNQTAVPLVAGSYTAGGVSYNYRSAELEAKSNLSSGSKTYTLTLADAAANSRNSSFMVTVNGSFKGSDFETDNVSGGVEGKPEKGDIVAFSFNNAPEPSTIVSGWSGSGTKTVNVSLADNSDEDTLTVSGATIGSVALKGNYTEGNTTFTGSSMSLSGSTVTIVLGSSAGGSSTDTEKNRPAWTPSASVFDQAWNACSTANVNGSSAKQF